MEKLSFDKYQAEIEQFDTMNGVGGQREVVDMGCVEKVLGLVGEAGETADKFKKIVRDKEGKILASDREELVMELGDVLWYVATIARYLGVPLSEVAEKNQRKLIDRAKRGKIHGAGDHR